MNSFKENILLLLLRPEALLQKDDKDVWQKIVRKIAWSYLAVPTR